MQSMQVFSSGAFSVKAHVSNEIAFFKAVDVAKALGYSNPQKAIRDHVFEEDRSKLEHLRGNVAFTHSKTEQGHTLYLTEAGVWALVFGSQKEEAKVFKAWLCREVLPRLRKHYQEQMRAPLSLRNESDLHHKLVQSIRRFWPHALLVAGLGELQDSPEKRMYAWRSGYVGGQPDLLILNAHRSHNGYAIELKNPKGIGKLTEKQACVLEQYRQAGFLTQCSDEYDVVLHGLVVYFQDIRLQCEMCGGKFKSQETLRRHCSKFHKCAC